MLNGGNILTAAEMLQAEQAIMDAGISIHKLMQRAGIGAAQQIMRILLGRKALVLCGLGNNGGDGYVIAQYLLEQGASVSIASMCEPKTDAARQAKSLWTGQTLTLSEAKETPVIIDCLFGTGLTRPIERTVFDDLTRLSTAAASRIAVDVPSGIQSDTGELLNDVTDFDLTIALGAYKPAHFLEPAKSKMGQLVGVEIGISASSNLKLVPKPNISAPLSSDHKYTRGLIAVVAGEMQGAANLAALAAQHSGAGYVKIFTPNETASPRNSIIMDRYCDVADLIEKLSDDRISAIVIGPGLGRGKTAQAALNAALSIEKPLVLDADALVLLGGKLIQQLNKRTSPVIITPHEGEFFKLGEVNQKLRVDKTRDLSRKSGAIVLLKGSDTIIVNPAGKACLQQYSCSWLSTAGTGDVLSGIIAARLAAEKDSFLAAKEGQWLHSRAGQLAGPSFSPELLIDQISAAIQECL